MRLLSAGVAFLALAVAATPSPAGTLFIGTDTFAFNSTGSYLIKVTVNGPTFVNQTNIPLTFPLNGLGNGPGVLYAGDPFTNTLRTIDYSGNLLTAVTGTFPASCCNESMQSSAGSFYHVHWNDTIQQIDPTTGAVIATFTQPDVVGVTLVGTTLWISKWNARQVGTWDPTTNIFTPKFSTPANAGGLAWDSVTNILWVGQFGGQVVPYDLGTNPPVPVNTGFNPITGLTTLTIDTVDGLVLVNIATVAGTGAPGFNGDNIAATSAKLNFPYGVAWDGVGKNLFIADFVNHRVRRVDATGTITTVAGTGVPGFNGDTNPTTGIPLATSAELNGPIAVALDATAQNLFIADTNNQRIRRVHLANGTITTVAGTGTYGLAVNSPPACSSGCVAATAATLWYPTGVAVDQSGNVYIADSINQQIRKVDAVSGNIFAVAGTAHMAGFNGEGIAATAALLNSPKGVAVDGNTPANVLIAEDGGNRVRQVNGMTGIISTLAGTGTAGFSGDGGSATMAQLANPSGVTVDASGKILIADLGNNRIRKVSGGVIATVAGTGVAGFNGDGNAATSQLNAPFGVAVDPSGSPFFIGDLVNQRVRRVGP